MKLSIRLLMLALLCSIGLSSLSQGVFVYKKDGSRVKYPMASIDSIVTYNYSDVDPVTGDNKSFTVNGVSFTMVAVGGGTFTMGATSEQSSPDSDEKPTHNVTLSDYYIGETEVTQELWKAVMGTNPSNFSGDLQRPVEKVSWNDCKSFITKLNDLTGESFHLPTEAQWEYAARGGSKSSGYQYSGGNIIGEVAWYTSNSGSTTHPVKTKSPNELGIYDMSGNVWEWCEDLYGSYTSSAVTDPTGPTSGTNRVNRGGSCYSSANCRVALRGSNAAAFSNYCMGFRIAL